MRGSPSSLSNFRRTASNSCVDAKPARRPEAHVLASGESRRARAQIHAKRSEADGHGSVGLRSPRIDAHFHLVGKAGNKLEEGNGGARTESAAEPTGCALGAHRSGAAIR